MKLRHRFQWFTHHVCFGGFINNSYTCYVVNQSDRNTTFNRIFCQVLLFSHFSFFLFFCTLILLTLLIWLSKSWIKTTIQLVHEDKLNILTFSSRVAKSSQCISLICKRNGYKDSKYYYWRDSSNEFMTCNSVLVQISRCIYIYLYIYIYILYIHIYIHIYIIDNHCWSQMLEIIFSPKIAVLGINILYRCYSMF